MSNAEESNIFVMKVSSDIYVTLSDQGMGYIKYIIPGTRDMNFINPMSNIIFSLKYKQKQLITEESTKAPINIFNHIQD